LVGGRVALGTLSNNVAKTGLAIAVRYALQRRQFGPKGKPEVPIMSYLLHQRRLIPLIATTYVYVRINVIDIYHFVEQLCHARSRFVD
jgi:acyl-CoA oxidase